MLSVYDIAYALGAVAAGPVLAWRLLRTGKWRTDWRGRFGGIAPLPDADDPHRPPTLLIHGVSVGEVNAVRGLVELLRETTNWRIVISATTDTGIARAQALYGDHHHVIRFPFDFGASMSRMLDAVGPDLVALTELEVWPNLMRLCDERAIPVCVINGRLSARSFGRYRLARPLLRRSFDRLTAAAVQTPDYARRFEAMGADPSQVLVVDSMKWDNARLASPSEVPGAAALAQAMGIDPNRPLLVAGSTGPGEEQMLAETCPTTAQLMFVPRKPERFEEVASLFPGIVRRSQHGDGADRTPSPDQRLFLLDTMGELRKAYALATVAIVGRSFLGLFGSDPTESIALGVPTIIGPYHSDFQDMVDALLEAGGLVVTDRPGRVASELLEQVTRAEALAAAGRDVILSRQGATARHAALLRRLMPGERD